MKNLKIFFSMRFRIKKTRVADLTIIENFYLFPAIEFHRLRTK